MNDLEYWRHWAFAASALVVSALVAKTMRAALKGAGQRRNWPILAELAPSISSLIYVLALGIFADLAPLKTKVDEWLRAGIYVVAVVVVLRIIRRGALYTIEWSASHSANSNTLQQGFIPLLRNLITLFVFFSGSIMILKRFNYDVMSLLTALGVGSLAVGLAAKDTLSNMISGFMLIIDRNLRPGDKINLNGAVGVVDEIGLRSTRIDTGNGNTLIVPNSELVNTKLLNLSAPTREVTCTSTFAVPYDVPFGTVRTIALETLAQVAKCNSNRGRWVNLDSLANGQQTVTVGFWLNDMDDQGAALTEFHEKLLGRFASERIALSVPPFSVPGRL